MSQHDPAFTRCPFEDCRVVSAGQTSIVNARDVEIGEAPKKTTDDVGVEVLVRCEAKHRTNDLLAPRQQAFPDSGRRESPLGLFPDTLGKRLALLQVGVDFRFVPKVVRDDGVHIDQRNRWVLLRDLLGGRPGLERVDDGFERDPGTRHAHDAVVIGVDGHPLEDVRGVHVEAFDQILRVSHRSQRVTVFSQSAAARIATDGSILVWFRNAEPPGISTLARPRFDRSNHASPVL